GTRITSKTIQPLTELGSPKLCTAQIPRHSLQQWRRLANNEDQTSQRSSRQPLLRRFLTSHSMRLQSRCIGKQLPTMISGGICRLHLVITTKPIQY
ncbi:hypothetical protein FRC11_001071, partial [Ceratobasidium sp. 423]